MYDLTPLNIALASLLVLVNGIISVWLKLNMEKRLLLAAVRTVVQLLLIGLILEWIFKLAWWPVILLLMFTMTMIASITAVQRSQRRFPGIWLNSIVAGLCQFLAGQRLCINGHYSSPKLVGEPGPIFDSPAGNDFGKYAEWNFSGSGPTE